MISNINQTFALFVHGETSLRTLKLVTNYYNLLQTCCKTCCKTCYEWCVLWFWVYWVGICLPFGGY